MMIGFLKHKAKKKTEVCGFKKETEQVLGPIGTQNRRDEGRVWFWVPADVLEMVPL